MTGTLGLYWKNNRIVLYMIPSTAIALAGLFYARTELVGALQAVVAVGSFGFLAATLVSTMWIYKLESSDDDCLKLDLDELEDPICLFFQRGYKMETFESKRSPGIFYTKIPLDTRSGGLEELALIFPDAGEIDTVWIKHWLPWNERWNPKHGNVSWKHVPVPHPAVFKCQGRVSRWKPIEDDEQYRNVPLFELGFSPADYKGKNGNVALDAYFRPIWEQRQHELAKEETKALPEVAAQ